MKKWMISRILSCFLTMMAMPAISHQEMHPTLTGTELSQTHSPLPYYLLHGIHHRARLQIVVIAMVIDPPLLLMLNKLKQNSATGDLELLLISQKNHRFGTKTLAPFDQLMLLSQVKLPYATVFVRHHNTLLLEKSISPLIDFSSLSRDIFQVMGSAQ